MNDEFNKSVKFWLQRVLEEKTKEIKKIADEISVLNHQQNNFHQMIRDETRNEVLEELMAHLRGYKWEEAIKELLLIDIERENEL